jgi:hypothetical protein
LAGRCGSCKKLRDEIAMCLLCLQQYCPQCVAVWNAHLAQHGGLSAGISKRQGVVYYTANGSWRNGRILYRNYLGEEFKEGRAKVREGEYMLCEDVYESIVEDLALENIGAKMMSSQE